jgi:outer membrane receptor protein involved in Fe transport
VSLSNAALGTSPSKANPSTIVANPAYDLLNASFYSPYWTGIVKRVKGNGLATKDANEGLVVKEDSFGLEGSFKLGGGVTLTENFRKSSRSGNFAVPFPTGEVFSANPGTIIASGPNAGKAYTGNALRVSAFNTSFDDLGNTVNALKLSKTFDMADAGKLTALVGWDTNNQTVSTTWALPHYLISATGDQPVMLNGTQGGQQTDATGQFPGGGWGGQSHNVKYDMSSPYVSLAYEVGALNLDGGIRQDNQKVQGYVDQAGSTTTYAPGTFNATPTTPVNYDKSRTSYSLGGNYRINKDLAAFARYSDGAVFSVLGRGSSTAYDGSQPIDLYTVKQSELGVKWRRDGLSVFATYFQAETYESNYTLTTQTASSTGYKSRGLEIEAAYRSEGFHVNGGITYTQAEIIYEGATPLNPTTIGNVPHRLPKYQYQITPSYNFGGLTIGGSLIGQTEAFSGGNDANDAIQDGFYVVNLFGSYQIDKHTSVYLSANNLFNKVGITEAQYPNGTEARSINGRTAKIGVKYTF